MLKLTWKKLWLAGNPGSNPGGGIDENCVKPTPM
jgi:hypothetical protein